MIRLLLLALAFYVIWNLLGMLLRSLSGPATSPPPEKSAAGEEMVRDPHCGTFIPRSDALSKNIGGTTHYFCSANCRDSYRAKKK